MLTFPRPSTARSTRIPYTRHGIYMSTECRMERISSEVHVGNISSPMVLFLFCQDDLSPLEYLREKRTGLDVARRFILHMHPPVLSDRARDALWHDTNKNKANFTREKAMEESFGIVLRQKFVCAWVLAEVSLYVNLVCAKQRIKIFHLTTQSLCPIHLLMIREEDERVM